MSNCLYPILQPMIEDEETFDDLISQCGGKPYLSVTIPTKNGEIVILMTLLVFVGNGIFCWKISCDKEFSGKDLELHPFRTCTPKNNEIWGNIADNQLSRTFFQYLSMSDSDLDQKSGDVPAIEYRARIISALLLFWD